jgi:hypothetical protein
MAKGRSFFKKKQRIRNAAMFRYCGPILEIFFSKYVQALGTELVGENWTCA